MIAVGVGLSFLLSGCSEKTDSDGFPKCGDEKVLKEAFGSFEKMIFKNNWLAIDTSMDYDFPKIRESQWREICKTVKFEYRNIKHVETNSAKSEKKCSCVITVLSQSELLPKNAKLSNHKAKYKIEKLENGEINIVDWAK